jgi:ribose transport system substrate-binding protein
MRPFLKPVLPLLLLGLTGLSGKAAADEDKRYQIGVIPKGVTHLYWKTIHAGVVKAGKDLGVDVLWVGSKTENDRKQQIATMRDFISRKVDAIVLAPLDDKALVEPVEEASKGGIPVVIIDSDLQSNAQVSFVATDNKEGGRKAADQLGLVMNGSGKALMLRYLEGSASTSGREEGFLEEMAKKYPDIDIVSSGQYAGADKEAALRAAQDILDKFPDVDGVFCPNEATVLAMLGALKASGKAGKVKFVGFDTGREMLEGLKSGAISALISQDPFNIGYEGVEAAVDYLKGQKVDPLIATRLLIVTRENMNEPKVKKVIHPDVDK